MAHPLLHITPSYSHFCIPKVDKTPVNEEIIHHVLRSHLLYNDESYLPSAERLKEVLHITDKKREKEKPQSDDTHSK